ncbi:hypothetical protein [Methylobacterium dankookense]|uniref:Uncharacterized protein n=1 Tax=Methylobacterium dankookense TaxID=560405 RepID=A0A564FU22_9HYPH|nr:hypothetical protein [Methylobacterium dankookense]GJD58198.1 hypothetical protein IFDJLNFL_4114 [Methylobacterium dankookense]VUF11266.1 hypothetical protein MTDSW087_00944 [Methylobacterium dankookense]
MNHRRTAVLRFGLILLGLLSAVPAARAADLRERPAPLPGRFLATCENLGRFCQAEGCGRDQIDAGLACRSACPGSVVMTVQPAACPLPHAPVRVVLRSRG